MLRLQLLHCLC